MIIVVPPTAMALHAASGVFQPLPIEEERGLRHHPISVVGVSVDFEVKTPSPFSLADAVNGLGNVLP